MAELVKEKGDSVVGPVIGSVAEFEAEDEAADIAAIAQVEDGAAEGPEVEDWAGQVPMDKFGAEFVNVAVQ